MLGDSRFKISILSLIITNLFLMVMAIILGWKTYDQMMVFWCENLVIGFYTVFKIPFCKMVDPEQYAHYVVPPKYIRIVIIPFFLLHFLLFCALHLVFINMMFASETEAYAEVHQASLFPEINREAMLYAIIALLINHGVSYFVNFIGRKEYLKFKIDEMMFVPYRRLVFVHLIVLAFGILVSITGASSAAMVVIFFLTKIWIDFRRHKVEHSQNPDSVFGWF